jgi:hypothetical protein
MPKRALLMRGLGISVALGCLVAFVGQALVPVLAKLPGLIVCGGEGFELVLRRRTSYGACGGGGTIHYGIVLLVSSIVWSIVCIPLGVLLARWLARRSQ